jgi:putative transposase
LELCRYVVLNPVRANLVASPEKWTWSSYGATAGKKKTPNFLTVDWILSQFGKTKKEARLNYVTFVMEGLLANSPWDEITGQIILGRRSFVLKLHRHVIDRSEMAEIPRVQRFAFRPSLESLFTEDSDKNKGVRNQIILKAYKDYGYNLTEIAGYLGLHYSTVSKVINKARQKNS